MGGLTLSVPASPRGSTTLHRLQRAGASQANGRTARGRHNEFNTEFGPVNVRLSEIGVAVELGDAGRALRAAATVDTSGLSAERQGRMLVDVARAHAQRRQSVRRSPRSSRTGHHARTDPGPDLARRTVSDLLTMQDPPSGELRSLAERLSIR